MQKKQINQNKIETNKKFLSVKELKNLILKNTS